MNTNEWEKGIVEAIRAAYPTDLWPDVPETQRPKDDAAAYLMRRMAPAVASIAIQTIEPLLSQATKEAREENEDLCNKIDTLVGYLEENKIPREDIRIGIIEEWKIDRAAIDERNS